VEITDEKRLEILGVAERLWRQAKGEIPEHSSKVVSVRDFDIAAEGYPLPVVRIALRNTEGTRLVVKDNGFALSVKGVRGDAPGS
jgi:hypothetical protein